MKTFLSSLRLLLVLTLLTGVGYPALVTGLAKLMPETADGSLVVRDGKVAGSLLVEQSFLSPKYFHGRPSVSDFTKPDGILGTSGSHLAPGDPRLRDAVEKRRIDILKTENLPAGTPVPVDLLLASASGIDPHISPEAAAFQTPRVARERGLPIAKVSELVDAATDPGGLLGPDVVNVLRLNLALDAAK